MVSYTCTFSGPLNIPNLLTAEFGLRRRTVRIYSHLSALRAGTLLSWCKPVWRMAIDADSAYHCFCSSCRQYCTNTWLPRSTQSGPCGIKYSQWKTLIFWYVFALSCLSCSSSGSVFINRDEDTIMEIFSIIWYSQQHCRRDGIFADDTIPKRYIQWTSVECCPLYILGAYFRTYSYVKSQRRRLLEIGNR